jgi:acetyltransferase-like isoleucine patch superfamily enzyme
VVAAGAVVTKDVAPLTVVGGIPATVIAQRPPEALDYCPADYRIPML